MMSAPAGGNKERILLWVFTLVKSHLERIVAPGMSLISLKNHTIKDRNVRQPVKRKATNFKVALT